MNVQQDLVSMDVYPARCSSCDFMHILVLPRLADSGMVFNRECSSVFLQPVFLHSSPEPANLLVARSLPAHSQK